MLKPYPHQEQVSKIASESRDYAFFWEVGCISGDASIRVNSAGCGRMMSLREFHQKREAGFYMGARVRSHLGDRIGLHSIVKTVYQGVKRVITIHLEDTKTLTLTPDHEVLTDEGYVRADELLHKNVCIDTPIPSKSGKKKYKCKGYLSLRVGEAHPYAIKFSPYTPPDGRPRNGYYSLEKHRLIYEAHENGLSLKEFRDRIKRGNIEGLTFVDPKVYHIHHKDHDYRNNDISNLEKLTHSEHNKAHNKFRNFSQGIPKYSKCVSITDNGNVTDVYDIVCEDPHRNFVVNDIVVHNCGKSGGIIHTLRKIYNKERKIKRTLIFSPLVTLFNWKNEFRLHSKIDPRDVVVLETASKRIKDFVSAVENDFGELSKGKIVVVNYEAVQNDKFFEAIQEWQPEIVILDEAHYCKNPKAKRAKKIVRITDNAERRFIMTGTPILNSVQDIFMQYRILDKGETFGKNHHLFMNKYMEDANAGFRNKPSYFPKWQARTDTYDELNKLIYKKASRLTKQQVLKDLPPFVETTRHVTLGTEQKKYYEQMKRDFVAFVNEQYENSEKSGAVIAQLAVTKALRLQQIVSGYVSTDEGEDIIIQNNPRLKELEELIMDITPNNKVIVWCSFRQNYKMIGRMLRDKGIKHVFITGEMNLAQKQESMDALQNDPDCRVVVANRRAAGIGINLVAASYSIVYSRNFSLGEEIQADGRNHRGGSQIHDKITKINLIARGTIDELVLEAIQNKHDLSKKIVDLAKTL